MSTSAFNISINFNVYQVLHCDPNCSDSELRKAFLSARSRYHPDKSKTGTEDAFRQVVDAYEKVNTPFKRARYNAQIGVSDSSYQDNGSSVLENVDDAFADLINYLRGNANFVPKSAYANIAKERINSIKKKVATKVAEKMVDTVSESIKTKVTSSATEGFAVLMQHYFSKKGAREPKEAVVHKTNIKKKMA